MSTKIYDAYRFKQTYSVNELANIFDEWRKEIKKVASEEFAQLVFQQFTTYFDIYTLFGIEKINRTVEKHKEIYGHIEGYNTCIENIRKAFINNNWIDAVIEFVFAIECRMKSNKSSLLKRRFTAELVVTPIEDKILFQYFGSNVYQDIIETDKRVLDYHYQDQTDKPKKVSKKAWEKRCFDWDKAIGPDYIPINHGFSVQLVNNNDIHIFSIFNDFIQVKNVTDDIFPTLDERIRQMIDMYDDYPNPPEDTSYSVMCKYMKTDEYKEWRNAKYEFVKSKLVANIKDVYCQNNKKGVNTL